MDGWKCPICGAGVAPSVEQCPCVKTDKAGGIREAAKKALEELQKAAPRIPPTVRPLMPYSPPWYPRYPFPARPPSDATPWNDPGTSVWYQAPGIGLNMGMGLSTCTLGIARAPVQWSSSS